MSTTSIAITGMRAANSIIAQTSHNIANSETNGFKSGVTELSNIEGDNGVQSRERNNIDLKGSLEYTGTVTDLAVSGNKSFFIVNNKINGEIVNVATGSFRPNSSGQLEYLGKYLLLGAQYDDYGNLPGYDLATLQPIVINTSLLSQSMPTTKITEGLSLNSGILAKGQGSFLMRPQDANSPGQDLNSLLIEGGDLVQNNGFMIQVQEEKNGKIVSEVFKCVFSGAISSTGVNATANTLYSAADDSIDITYNGVSTSIKRSAITGSTSNNLNTMTRLQDELTSLGLRAELNTSNPTSITLTILPPTSGSDSLAISGQLAIDLGITANISPVQKGSIRFASMKDLKDALSPHFSQIKSNAHSDSLAFIAQPNTSIYLENLQDADVLSALGLSSGPVKGQGYDPYDDNANMASGNVAADVIKVVTLFDSKGEQHLLNIALKKVEDGWMQEVYIKEPGKVSKIRDDGLLQVTKFTFDQVGNFLRSSGITPTITVSRVVSDPFAAIDLSSSTGAHAFTVAGRTFTLGTPGLMSMVDLANAINSDSASSAIVQATIVQDGDGYRLKLLPKTSTLATVTSDVLGVVNEAPLPDASQELIIEFNENQNLKPIKLSFDFEDLSESAHQEVLGEITANGIGSSTLASISISNDGDIIGTFANGMNKKLYKIPLATFANVNGLSILGDNALRASATSGSLKIVSAGTSSAGEILAGNLETSNVEQAEQLTKLVTNKQFYNMNTKSWQTGNAIIDYLLNATN